MARVSVHSTAVNQMRSARIFEGLVLNQTSEILSYLKSGKSITPLEALNLFGCFRLGARIWDLEQEGIKIKHELVSENGKTFARYSISGGDRLNTKDSSSLAERQEDVMKVKSFSPPSLSPAETPKVFYDEKNKRQQIFPLGI